jgi:hypothetical protein
MSAVPVSPLAHTWPADVLAFAVQNKVDAYLDPLLDATLKLFPTARSIENFLEDDPEIRDDTYIVFEVRVPRTDVPDFVQMQHAWIDELNRVCPASSVGMFLLGLELL